MISEAQLATVHEARLCRRLSPVMYSAVLRRVADVPRASLCSWSDALAVRDALAQAAQPSRSRRPEVPSWALLGAVYAAAELVLGAELGDVQTWLARRLGCVPEAAAPAALRAVLVELRRRHRASPIAHQLPETAT